MRKGSPLAIALNGDGVPSRPLRLRIWAIALVAAALLAAVVYRQIAGDAGDPIHDAVSQGRPATAPKLDLELLTAGDLGRAPRRWWRVARDGRVALAELRGNPVVINFWTSGCVACREEAPVIERAARDAGHRVLVLGVGNAGSAPEARSYLHELGVSFPQVLDGSGETARQWGVDGVPETFFLSGNGEIVGHVVGVARATDLRQGMAAAASGRPSGLRTGGKREPIG